MSSSNPRYNRGDLVLFNESGNFGNDRDRLFHIHSVRYGTCTGVLEKQNWYSGYLFRLGDSKSKGLPVFSTTITNVSESKIKRLEGFSIGN